VFVSVATLAVWMLYGAGDRQSVNGRNADSSKHADVHVDMRALESASIAGTIRDEAGAPIGGARVCVDELAPNRPKEFVRSPRCVATDAQGGYLMPNLYGAQYNVAAMAWEHLPKSLTPDSDGDIMGLRAGEHKTGVDIVLLRGGVEVTGVVYDVGGGPIAHAMVWAVNGNWQTQLWPAVETDDAGKFSLWVRPDNLIVTAIADGYAEGIEIARAPGKVDILLTPESSLSGAVVDAKTNEPVAGVLVEAVGDDNGNSDITDDQGHFHITHITSGRYTLVARSPHRYGHSEGSSQVGLGQHVMGVVVKLYPAFQISGRVVEPGDKRATCKLSSLQLRQAEPSRVVSAKRNTDGSLQVDGVLPGTYDVTASCDGFIRRDNYRAISITDKDVTHLEWEVDVGAELGGHVLTKSGSRVEGAWITAQSVGGGARERESFGADTSREDGEYRIRGLKQGTYEMNVVSGQGSSPTEGWKIEVRAMTVDKNLVLADVGTIKGIVVDIDGTPVAGANITVRSAADGAFSFSGLPARSGEDGSFILEGVRPGDQRVLARRGLNQELRKPGSNDDAKQGEHVIVAAGQIASIRLVVESQSAAIKGVCVDINDKPVTDAYVFAARESDTAGSQHSNVTATRWSSHNKPTLTSSDGSFQIGQLSSGAYTVRVERKGGGEAVAEHVVAGASISLVFKPTGQIDGFVHDAHGALDEFTIWLHDDKTGLLRDEEFFRTGGTFTIRDVPAGSYTITASAGGGKKQITLDLVDGERRKVDVQLDSLVTLTGRVVEFGTTTPVPGILMVAVQGESLVDAGSISRHDNTSDATGHFTIKNAPTGIVRLYGLVMDPSPDYDDVDTVQKIDGSGTIDLGDITVLKRRLKPGDTDGELGVRWVQQPVGTPPEQQRFEISWIDPNGAAAKTELKVGDVVTTVDGIDVAGANHARGYTLMRAAPPTKLVLGLSRGVAVTVVLTAPS
jgi:hypothetical protein